VRTAAFSPGARLALEGLERLARSDAVLGLVTAVGVDVQGFAAHAHLSSPRADGPFVTLDGTSREARQLENWRDPARSPLVAADGGSLLVASAAALPREVQEHLAQFLVARTQDATATSMPAAGLILGLPRPAAELAGDGRLHDALARALSGRELALPRLADRAEDLRALVLEGLSRFGIATSGEPLGIEPAALAALAEHDFPGNEQELFGLLARTAAGAQGPRITLPDLMRNGLGSAPKFEAESEPEPADPQPSPAASLAVRRRSLRRAR